MKQIVLHLFFPFVMLGTLSATTITVSSSNFAFTPNAVNATTEDVIAFVNSNGFHFVEWLTAPGALPANSGTLSPTPQNYTLTLAGTYTYRCGIHTGSMFGSITITALPIELRYLSAEPVADKISIKWLTETETNSDYFSIERALNDGKFKEIGVKKAAGNSAKANLYEFEDADAPSSIVYYRLKTVDVDKSFQYSNVVSLRLSKPFTAKIYPNPAQNTLNFEWNLPTTDHLTLTIVDITGKIIAGPYHIHQHHDEGFYNLEVKNWASGAYMAQLKEGNIVKQNIAFTINK